MEQRKLRTFLCHSSADKPTVRDLYQRLVGEGFIDPWLDVENLKAGQDWQREIYKAVHKSDVVIVCLSHDSINKAGFVQKEIVYALDAADEQPENSIFLIPLRLEECRVPNRLRTWHWINYFEEDGYTRLIDALECRAKSLDIGSYIGLPSVAILPFANLSTDPDMEFFCDGLAGELINKLAKIEGLRVAARTSTFWFKGKNSSINEIGRRLKVDSVLEGSITKVGRLGKISVELISISKGYCLWAEEYTLRKKDILNIQDKITMSVAAALKVKMLKEERIAALKRYTDNVKAYELYLTGRYYFYKHTNGAWQKAIEYFEKATELEPEYAPAYAGLSSVIVFPWYFGLLHPDEAIPKWKMATGRALELDGDLDESHVALGQINFFYEWNWEKAELEYKRAIDLNPRNAYAHQQYGLFLSHRGQHEQAINEGRLALELDPLSLFVNFQVGWIYFWTNHIDNAALQAARILEMEPSFYGGRYLTGAIALVRGKYKETSEEVQKAVNLGGGDHMLSFLGLAYCLIGKRKQALLILNWLLEGRKQHYVTAFDIARLYAGLSDHDKAFEWLGQAYREREGQLVWLKLKSEDLWGKDFVTDSRFVELRRHMSFG